MSLRRGLNTCPLTPIPLNQWDTAHSNATHPVKYIPKCDHPPGSAVSATPQAQDKSRATLLSEKVVSRWAVIKPSEDAFIDLSVNDAMDAHIATVVSFPEIADLSSEEKREVLIGTWRNTWNTQLRQELKAQYAADYDVILPNGLARHESDLLHTAQGSELHHDVFEGIGVPERESLQPPVKPGRSLSRDSTFIQRRIGAYILDSVFISIAALMVGAATGSIGPDSAVNPAFAVWALILEVLYRWAMQATFGFTVGKFMLGLRLVGADGNRAGPLRVLGRETSLFAMLFIAQNIPGLPQPLLPALVQIVLLYVVIRRPDRRSLHDLIVKTQVIHVTGRSKTE